MISSPCKTCPRKNQPKEDCYKGCALLQAIQDIECSTQKDPITSGIDYSEENRFAIHLSTANGSPIFN